jgi:RHS repeat-associated protein
MKMKNTSARRATLACALLATTAFCGLTATPAAAQTAPAPRFQEVDRNGVDLISGRFVFSMVEGTIGSGDGMVTLTRSERNDYGRTDEWSGVLFRRTVGSTSQMVAQFGNRSDTFSISGSTYTGTKGNGATLTAGSGGYVYTASDGTTVTYSDAGPSMGYAFVGPGCSLGDAGTCALPMAVTRPNGTSYALTWDIEERCHEYDSELNCVNSAAYYRFEGVTSSTSYAFSFNYLTDNPLNQGAPQTNWYKRTGATFTNNLVTPSTLPTVTYSAVSTGVEDVTDTGGRTWRITSDTSGRITGIRRPGSTSDDISVTYGTGGIVSSIAQDGTTTSYSRSLSGTTATTTITQVDGDPNTTDPQTTVVADLTKERVTSVTDPLSRTTGFTYDSNSRPTRTTLPEGNYVELTYDSRGNVTQTRSVSKSGTGPEIVTSASFPCTQAISCNSPESTTDARGNTTDYTYDSTHGGLLTVTPPAPTTNATRPQVRYTYTLTNGEYRATAVSACQTTSSCTGGADEVKASVTFDANGNLTSSSSGNGSGTLTATQDMTYDAIGNLLTVDGPLSDTADTVRYHYNAAREVVGVVGPDPDGSGALKHRALRTTYRSDGLPTKVEQGTVNSQSDSDWAAFSSAQETQTDYDGNDRPVMQKLVSGSTVYSLGQTSYDALGRPECIAQRMDPNDFGSTLPAACTLTSPAGSFGPDRIVKTIYDAAGQVTQVKTALGVTGEEANELTATYSNNGAVQTVTDAESNKTTFEYDGHDRLLKTFYPSTTKGAGTSSTTDYEQLTYENTSSTRTSGTVASFLNRAGESIGFSYDALGRPTTKDLPGTEPDTTYVYDLLDRPISASKTGENMSFTYDALGRLLSQTNPGGTVSATWDLAGRRTRITWPDTHYADYDYLVTGDMSAVRYDGATSGYDLLATYAFDDLGRRTSLTRGNGTSTSYAYDAVSRLTSLSHNLGGSVTTHDLTIGLSYNPASQIHEVTRSNDLYAWTKHGSGTTSTTSNGLNQLASWNATVTHDAKGNITSDGTNSFSFSPENLMTGVTVPPYGSASFAYDPTMRLASSGLQRFHRFQDDILAEYYGSILVERMIPGAGEDETVATMNRFGVRNWYYADERGSNIATAGDAGTGTSQVAYDEYGKPGTTTPPRMGYTGQMLLITDKVYDYKNRMYHPGLGRFLQPDPIGYNAGMNLYAYVNGDPINFIDTSGTETDWGSATVNGIRCHADQEADFDKKKGRWVCNDLPTVPTQSLLGSLFSSIGTALDNFAEDHLKPEPPRAPGETFEDCMKRLSNPKAAAAGATAIGAGGRFVPYPRTPFGGGGGGTSVISGASRAAFGRNLRMGSTRIAGTNSVGGAFGRVLSRISVVGGVALYSFSAGQAAGAAQQCRKK